MTRAARHGTEAPMSSEPPIDAPSGRQVWVEDDRTSMHPAALRRAFHDHLRFSRGRRIDEATAFDCYTALALSVRDRLVERWNATERAYAESRCKRVYYLSAEFLLGRLLLANLQALGIEHAYRSVLADLGIDLDEIIDHEPEPGLGNGGLGRLAACFLESLATLGLPGSGYGIRYEFGIFEQVIRNGQQVERADEWLRFGCPWELARPEYDVEVQFGGQSLHLPDQHGGYHVVWRGADRVYAVPHDIPIAGYRTSHVNALRLWRARAGREFDFDLFNAGDYVRAVEEKNASEVISKVLYPNDNFEAGRELRLRQEYFFASCSIQDIVRSHLGTYGTLANLSDKVAIQLNDTHPAVAIPELMRLLVDQHAMTWEAAWKHCVTSFGYTNHTLMPEALEKWPVELMARLLPRHLEIIREVNRRFLREVITAYPHDRERAARMAVLDEASPPQIHMAHLAVVGSHAVNGVAQLHTDLLKSRLMKDFHELYPTRFCNKTNGVTPRRWLLACNPELTSLVRSRIGDGFVTNLERLRELEPHAEDTVFRASLREVKRHHQERLGELVRRELGVEATSDHIFDVQVKRLHEYKRQLLNLFHIVHLYLRAKRGETVTPRLFLFGAKAAPGYRLAKIIIRLIHAVADVVNKDPRVPEVRLAFLPNYRVTLAERIIPAADVSEQISTAGKEASGTGNMKLSMNGALTVGTLDGANVEIRAAVGEENFFHFGMTVDEVVERRRSQPAGRSAYLASENVRAVVDLISDGFFSPDEPALFRPFIQGLLENDEYMVLAEFEAYAACQARVAEAYADPERWSRMSALNIARIGGFSSDRTIQDYAREIWGVSPVRVELPAYRSTPG
ncbi:MAG: glycogen/starch/alpha-glucan phosphorylase [Myxococcales bacterium]|nr:glycogen/starch/alpha-glucan phosphorylase [Myxococcales bacterium]